MVFFDQKNHDACSFLVIFNIIIIKIAIIIIINVKCVEYLKGADTILIAPETDESDISAIFRVTFGLGSIE